MQNVYVLTVDDDNVERCHYIFSTYENAVEYGSKIFEEIYGDEELEEMIECLRENGEIADIMWISNNAIDSCIEIY